MNFEKKIAWQKYEDYIEKQLSSPILINILQNLASLQNNIIKDEEADDEEDDDYDIDDEIKPNKIITTPFMPLTNQLMEDISMLSTFDCWIGHTNFDVTHNIKNILDEIPGIELLKICSRYRFFIGIGKLFDFKNVRKDIENAIIEGD